MDACRNFRERGQTQKKAPPPPYTWALAGGRAGPPGESEFFLLYGDMDAHGGGGQRRSVGRRPTWKKRLKKCRKKCYARKFHHKGPKGVKFSHKKEYCVFHLLSGKFVPKKVPICYALNFYLKSPPPPPCSALNL